MKLTLHGLVEAAAANLPDNVAVVDGNRSVTYSQLDERANRIANYLIGLGVRRGDRVALYMEKSAEAFAGLYAVLKCGAAYVPFDPGAPGPRLGYMAENCGIEVVLTSAHKADTWGELCAGGTVRHLVTLDADDPVEGPAGVETHGREKLDLSGAHSPQVPVIDADLAYIIYTSGSTGDPKGVKLSHLNGLAFVRWVVDEFEITPRDRLSSHAPLHFDLSILDVFAAAHAGARVVIVPPKTSVFPSKVVQFIERHEISIWYSVPSVLSMIARRGGLGDDALPTLRVIFFAGEVFPTKYLRILRSLVRRARFANLYGPTETNVCTWWEVTEVPDGDDPIPIGHPIAGVDAFAVDEDGTPVGEGAEGELWVRGSTVMQGYWANPERTGQSLLPNPLMPEAGDRVYRTGDVVVRRPDGAFDFLGRRDSQIKSRGYRIELGDIESALYSHPDVVECAVVAVPDDMFSNRILAYVVMRSGAAEADLPEADITEADLGARLSAHCREQLPPYMVPEMWERREALPRTSTGKVDRRDLTAAVRDRG